MVRMTSRVGRWAVGAAVAVLGASGASGQEGLYGVAGFSNFGVQSLYRIDAETGAATLVGPTGLRQVAGVTWDRLGERLLALTVQGDLYRLDLTTGASELVRDGTFGVPEGSLALVGSTPVTTIGDNLHALGSDGWQLVGPSGLPAGSDVSGLELVGGGLFGLALNGSAPDTLVLFDVATGAATHVGETGTNTGSVAGLAFDFNRGGLFMTDSVSLFAVNTAGGVATLIGSHGVGGFSGIAYVPGPTALGVLGAAAIGLGRRRRHARR